MRGLTIVEEVINSVVMVQPRAEHFRFGPVLNQNKQPNRFYFFFNFLNRTEPKTGSNRLISVRFGLVFFSSKPVQTEIIPTCSQSQKNP
jgi:hypothetical protein